MEHKASLSLMLCILCGTLSLVIAEIRVNAERRMISFQSSLRTDVDT